MLIRLKRLVLEVGRKIDQAINLGVASMYPLVFSLPAPDPIPDWKRVVRLGWKVVTVTAAETTRLIKENGFPKLEIGTAVKQKGPSIMAANITWDANKRLAVLSRVLITIQGDLSSGCYGRDGRPTLYTAVQVIHAEPEWLNTAPSLSSFLYGLEGAEIAKKPIAEEQVAILSAAVRLLSPALTCTRPYGSGKDDCKDTGLGRELGSSEWCAPCQVRQLFESHNLSLDLLDVVPKGP